MLKNIKKYKKTIFSCIICSILFCFIGAGATSLIYSKDVTYDNSKSGLSSTTVQGALDELYESAKNGGAKVSCNDNGECTVTCKRGSPTITDSGYSCVNTTKVTCPDGKNFIATANGYKCSDMPVNERVVTSGDGLYKDTVTDGRYYYRGSSPKNYVTFNNETWRIISIESNGMLKMVRNEQLSGKYQWDVSGTGGNRSAGTYCIQASTYGCNAWAATRNLINEPNEFVQYEPNGNISDSETRSGTVTSDSAMLTYLNGTYYNSLSNSAKTKIVKGIYNVSTPGDINDTESLETDAKEEKQYQWKGYVALYTITELLRASTNSECISLRGNGTCKNNNWLWPTFNTNNYEWTLSPYASNSNSLWYIYYLGYASDYCSHYYNAIRPVLFLSNTVQLKGTGSSTDPYVITN